jgi:anti-sigma factor RsiW
MKTHLNDGELRAALDGELESGRLHHLDTCAACQARRQQMQTSSLETARRLAFLQPGDESGPPPRQAWARFSQQISRQKEYSMTKKWFSRPLVGIRNRCPGAAAAHPGISKHSGAGRPITEPVPRAASAGCSRWTSPDWSS